MPTSTSLKRGAPESQSQSTSSKTIISEAAVVVQPLRDFAKNFDIDIHSYLDEYLQLTQEYLEEDMGVVVEGGVANQQNFAEAALKIQNSAGIYNRKVDFLHKVTYEVYTEFISSLNTYNNKSRRKRPSSASNKNGDSSIEAFHDYDIENEFLLLDDVLPMDKSLGRNRINLKEDHRSRVSSNGGWGNGNDVTQLNDTLASQLPGGALPGGPNGTPNDVTLLSLGGVMSATRLMDQNGTFMINRSSLDNASPGVMSRMLMANLQGGQAGGGTGGGGGGNGGGRGGEGNLRFFSGMCDVDANTGALLMPGTRASVFVNGEATTSTNNGEEIQIFPEGLSPTRNHGVDGMDESNDFGAVTGNGNDNDDNISFGGVGGGEDWGGDDNNDGVGFELNDDHNMNEEIEEKKEDENDTINAAYNALNVDDDNDIIKAKPKKKVIEDPWAVLDKDEPYKDKVQPLRIGVTTRLPPEVEEEDRPSASVTGSRTRAKKKSTKQKKDTKTGDDFTSTPFLTDIIFDEAMLKGGDEGEGDTSHECDETLDESNDASVASNKKASSSDTPGHLRLLKKLKNKEFIFGNEFAYIAKAHAKHRDALRKQRRLQLRKEQRQSEAGMNNNVMLDLDDDNHADFGGGGGFDFGGDDDNDSFGQPEYGTEHNEAINAEAGMHRSNVDSNAIDFLDCGGFDNHDYNDNDDFGGQHQTFEELCRAHLRKFAKSAEIYAAETQLTKRVSQWQDGLAPLLEEQETRPEFDIHSCGRQILQSVERNVNVRKRTSTGEKKFAAASSIGTGNANNSNNMVAFSSIFEKDCEDYEVCRLFLSTLMLCNHGNVTVHDSSGSDGEIIESLDSIKIELLDNVFQPPMEAYIAPSAENVYEKENVATSSTSNLGVVDENVSTLAE